MVRLSLVLCVAIYLVFVLVPEDTPATSGPEAGMREADEDGGLTELTLDTGEVWAIDRVVTPSSAPEPAAPLPPAGDAPAPEDAGAVEDPEDAAPSDGSPAILYVTGTRVNMRAGPSTDDAIVTALSQGTATELLDEAPGGWVQIRDPLTGTVGFMSGDFLSSTPP
ncbi:MAG: SH3 domain-containing protein [Pseudomonadota bacterium]